MASSTTSKVLIFLGVVIVVVGAAVFYLGRNLDGIVASLIESQGSAATGTDVSVQGVQISLSEAAASISGLSIGNPDGFPGNALELGQFAIQLDAKSLTSDTIVIKGIKVAEAHLNVLQDGNRNNLQMLLANLQQGEQPGESAPAEDSGEGKLLIIDRLTFSGIGASVSVPDLEEQREVELPPIDVTGIGRDTNGATAAQVAAQVLQPLLEAAIASAAAQAVKDRAGEKIDEAVGGFLRKLGGNRKDGE